MGSIYGRSAQWPVVSFATGKGLFTMASAAILLVLLSAGASGTIYEVGPDKAYESIGAVPWEGLVAGDTVRIFWRETPYKEKWVICRRGTAEAPITVCGVAGPAGQLPVIDGRDATTRAEINYWGEERSVIKIGGANKPADTTPAWIVIENLDVRSGRPPYSFTGRNGLTKYKDLCAGIHIEKGEHITIRNCRIHDCGNGFFAGGADVLVEGCYLWDNGIEGSIYHHQSYTAAAGITFQYNHYGPLRKGCKGSNLKDRSSGLVIRYNWIEGGGRELDLVDAEDNDGRLVKFPHYHESYVYGNILIEPEGAGNSQIIHYGGDSDHREWYRKGTLYLYNNTIVSTRPDNTVLVNLSTNDEHCDCRNNIIYLSAPGSHFALLDANGIINLSHNWMKPGWRTTFEGAFHGKVNDDKTTVSGEKPGFVDFSGQDFRLAKGSECINAGAPLSQDVLPANDVVMEYVRHLTAKKRPKDAVIDIGALEYEE